MNESLDILEFWPSTVLDLIFQHLTPNEVLNATLVHPLWNEFISINSLTCWKGITIQPKATSQLHHLVNSVRRYENLKAVNVSSIVPELIEIFTKPGRKWKKIEIFRTEFDSRDQVEQILRVSAKTVEHLELLTIACKTFSEKTPESFDFPQLQQLRISYHSLDDGPCWISTMISSAKNLEVLQLNHACDTRMKELIVAGTKLTRLAISGRFQDEKFFHDLALNLPPRFEVFEFNDILSSSNEDENLSHFNNFFKSQGKSLRKFDTDALLELEELESAFKMPNLHTLNIKGFHYNNDIVNGYLDTLRSATVPEANLKVLNIQRMDQNLLEILAINARGLLVLRSAELLASDASNPAWFPKLEKVQVFYLENELEKHIREKGEANRSRLERLIFEGISNET